MPARQRAVFLALAILWLALRVPHFFARFSFDWDSSQYARALTEFNIVKHQPQPPGYLLWVLGARVLHSQIRLAFLISLAALAIFYCLARCVLQNQVIALCCTALLAYSPAVALNSSIPSPSIADLLASCIAGYLGFLDSRRPWIIATCLAALGVVAGFHQSNLALLAPLVVVAAIRHLPSAPRAVIAGAICGALCFLAWYLPLAHTAGGFGALSQLTSAQFHDAAAKSSIFYGAPLRSHLSMTLNNSIYVGMTLAPWLIAFGWPRASRNGWLYLLWLAPTLIVLLAIHSGRAGYWLIAFPPLLLFCAASGRIRMPTVLAAIVVSLGISYFPYSLLQSSKIAPISYVFYRSTPRIALDVEQSQRKLASTLHELGPQQIVCTRDVPEAPNIRTVTYDFPNYDWLLPSAAPVRALWLFDQRGPSGPNWRKIAGDELWSIWEPQALNPNP